jgi:hypothetical protein
MNLLCDRWRERIAASALDRVCETAGPLRP